MASQAHVKANASKDTEETLSAPTERQVGKDYPLVSPNSEEFYDAKYTWKANGVDIRRGRYKQDQAQYIFLSRMGLDLRTNTRYRYRWNMRAIHLPGLIKALQGIQQELDVYPNLR